MIQVFLSKEYKGKQRAACEKWSQIIIVARTTSGGGGR
jgi:hypothetical protein